MVKVGVSFRFWLVVLEVRSVLIASPQILTSPSISYPPKGLTKDHESGLKKQKEDIGYLSRHLDHVINFTKWATARNGGTALLYCKRLVRPPSRTLPQPLALQASPIPKA